MRVRVTLAAGLAAVVAVFAIVLAQRDERRSGADMTPFGAFATALQPAEQSCQKGELLPADTAAVRMTIGTYGRPGEQIGVVFTGPEGRMLSSGTLRPSWRAGRVRIPISPVAHPHEEVTACVRNEGTRSIAIAGAPRDPGYTMTVGHKTVEGRLRYDYMRPGRESWYSLLPAIVHRSTLAKSGLIREWAWAGALLLVLAAIALTARVLLREEPL